jgi:hypothetical protein
MNYTLIIQGLTSDHEQMASLNRAHLQNDEAWEDPRDWTVDE